LVTVPLQSFVVEAYELCPVLNAFVIACVTWQFTYFPCFCQLPKTHCHPST